MEYITHDEFDTRVRTLGFHAYYWEDLVEVTNSEKEVICTVYEYNMYSLSTEYYAFHELDEYYKKELIRLCVQLASTPSNERKRIKKYFYKIRPEYRYLFPGGNTYLRCGPLKDRFLIGPAEQSVLWQTEFTEEECKELELNFDLSILQRVEVCNELPNIQRI